jgi:hypothetical protein
MHVRFNLRSRYRGIHPFKLGSILIEEFLYLSGGRNGNSPGYFRFVQTTGSYTSPLRFQLQQNCIDLKIQNAATSLSNLVLDTFQFLTQLWRKVSCSQCLTVYDDQRRWRHERLCGYGFSWWWNHRWRLLRGCRRRSPAANSPSFGFLGNGNRGHGKQKI